MITYTNVKDIKWSKLRPYRCFIQFEEAIYVKDAHKYFLKNKYYVGKYKNYLFFNFETLELRSTFITVCQKQYTNSIMYDNYETGKTWNELLSA